MPGIDAARLPLLATETIPRFDTEQLSHHALLQPMLHEILRMYVTGLTARYVEYNVVIGQTQIPGGLMVLIVPWL
jgi:cytochrome P450